MSNKDEDLKHGKETALGRSGEQGECPRDLEMCNKDEDVFKQDIIPKQERLFVDRENKESAPEGCATKMKMYDNDVIHLVIYIQEWPLVNPENKESAPEIYPEDKDVDSDKGYEDENEVKMRLGSETLTEGADFLMTARQNKEIWGWIGLV